MIGLLLIGIVLGYVVRFAIEIINRNQTKTYHFFEGFQDRAKAKREINDIEVKDYKEVK